MTQRIKKQIALSSLAIIIAISSIIFLYGVRTDNKNIADNVGTQPDHSGQSIDRGEPDEAYLKSVDVEGFGLTKRIYSNGRFMHIVSANLPKVDEPEFYQGWLLKPGDDAEAEEFIATGRLTDMDSEFFLFYESDKDLRDFTKIVVTKQNSDDGIPDAYVLVGSFVK